MIFMDSRLRPEGSTLGVRGNDIFELISFPSASLVDDLDQPRFQLAGEACHHRVRRHSAKLGSRPLAADPCGAIAGKNADPPGLAEAGNRGAGQQR